MNPLDAARRLLVEEHGAEFVVAYGSFASETHEASSDIDVMAWAPVPEPRALTGVVAGHELDAWLYPLDHPFTDSSLSRAHPFLVLHDPKHRAPAFQTAVEASRVFQPLDAGQKAATRAWIGKMLARARTGTPEGLQRYHWLLSDGPELWCQFTDRRWDGPKKALTLMQSEDPALYQAYGDLASGPVSVEAAENWLGSLIATSDALPKLR